MSYTQLYPIDYTSTGNNVGENNVARGAVKKLETDLTGLITDHNTLETTVGLASDEDTAYFFVIMTGGQ